MKMTYAWLAPFIVAASSVFAAEFAQRAEPQILEKGQHHRVWSHVTSSTAADGTIVLRTNRYTELAINLYYRNEQNELIESRESIEIVPGGALAAQGAHKVGFAANANTAGAINMLTTDGKRLRSHVLGLAYINARTGETLWIAQIRDSIGELVGENQIIYRDAFNSDGSGIKADIRYTYTRAGLEQDIIFREGGAPPSPEAYGFAAADVENIRLEVVTEFIEAPTPQLTGAALSVVAPQQRVAMAMPEFIDQTVDFEAMRMEAGQAFPLDGENIPQESVPTGKRWHQQDGRTFLIEAVDYSAIKSHLDTLTTKPDGQKQARAFGKPGVGHFFPNPPLRAKAENKMLKTASLGKKERGFVIDYNITSGVTNFVFRADTTYYVGNSQYTLWGSNNVIEGGTVIKYTNTTGLAILRIHQGLDCQTSPYHPALLTSMHDNSVGDIIANSTGNPTNYCSAGMLWLGNSFGGYFNLHDLRLSHAYRAFYGTTSVKADISNCQVIHSAFALKNNASFWNIRNILIANSLNAFDGVSPHTNSVENMTLFAVSNMVIAGLPAVNLTNALLIGVTNGVAWAGANVETNLNGAGIFQTVGSGAYYLATNSPYRGVGTTNVNQSLLAALRDRTTYPPDLLTNVIATNLTLSPKAVRDTNASAVDLGYHYDAIDYLFQDVAITNATLTLTNGVCIAVATNSAIGIRIDLGGRVVSDTSPLALNRLFRASSVQEHGGSNSTSLGHTFLMLNNDTAGDNRFHFTDFPLCAGIDTTIYTNSVGAFRVVDCQLRGGSVENFGGLTFLATNTLFERVKIDLDSADSPINAGLYNCLVRSGPKTSLRNHVGPTTVQIINTLFDSVGTVGYDFAAGSTNLYNAFYATTVFTNAISPLVMSELTYLVGPFGRYYQPTNSPLIDFGMGNVSASRYEHYTITTNNVRDTMTMDIGLHYHIVNLPPIISLPGAQTTAEDTTLVLSGISISDPNGSKKVEQMNLSVNHGRLALSSTNGLLFISGSDGSGAMVCLGTLASLNAAVQPLSYLPELNFHGSDALTVIVNDLASSAVGGALAATGSVSITVTPVNDPPIAVDDSYSIGKNSSLMVSAVGVLGNDSDAEGTVLIVVPVAGASHGSVSLSSNGSFTYTPDLNFIGQDNFTYKADDGTNYSDTVVVTINVTNTANHPPTISITTPTNGTSYVFGDTVEFTVSVSDEDAPGIGGSIVRVEYFKNAESVGVATSPPFSLSLSGLPISTNTFTAVATDDLGLTNTSASVQVFVDGDCDGDGVSDKQEERNGTSACNIYPELANSLRIVSGNYQVAGPGQLLPAPLIVEVTDYSGRPQSNAVVEFSIRAGGGFVVNPSGAGLGASLIGLTGTNGQASIQHKLPMWVGSLSLIDATHVTSNTIAGSPVYRTNVVTFAARADGVGAAIAQVDAGFWHTLALQPDGSVYAWGYNGSPPAVGFVLPTLFNNPTLFSAGGQLGDGGTNNSSMPQAVSGLSAIVAVSAGGYHSAALQTDGTPVVWGHNERWQMGNGTTNAQRTPVAVAGVNNVAAIEAGGYHTLFLRSNGTVYACGRNDYGQLGDGSTAQRTNAVQVNSLANITSVAAGVYHSLALSNGHVYIWGETNAEMVASVPKRVASLANIVSLAAGRAYSLALDNSGNVFSWGDNEFGQLGQTNTALGQIAGLSNIVTISAGVYHAMAVDNTGRLWAWGRNDFGQLGDGTTTQANSPVIVTNGTGAFAISVGAMHNMALTQGQLKSWGNNSFGQLGNGSTTSSTTPVTVGSLPGAVIDDSILEVFTPLE